jgi:predicted AlkP superfamily pyrophosphatase or phosphodiesterase
MQDATLEEVQIAFNAAKNLNAALKTFIKREVRSGEPIERFAKDFRAAVATGRPTLVNSFIEKHYPKNEVYFLVLARYAFSDFISSVVEVIFEKYAEDFNTSYESTSSGIRVTNADKFSNIGNSVVEMVDQSLLKSALPSGNFLKKATLLSIFEPNVFQEVIKVIK